MGVTAPASQPHMIFHASKACNAFVQCGGRCNCETSGVPLPPPTAPNKGILCSRSLQTHVRLAGWCSYPHPNTTKQSQKMGASANKQKSPATYYLPLPATAIAKSRSVKIPVESVKIPVENPVSKFGGSRTLLREVRVAGRCGYIMCNPNKHSQAIERALEHKNNFGCSSPSLSQACTQRFEPRVAPHCHRPPHRTKALYVLEACKLV